MTLRLIGGFDQDVAEWVAARIPHMAGQQFGACTAIGVMRDDEPVAGVTYHNFHGHIVEVSIAAEPGSRWCSRSVLNGLFAYPFVQLGCVVMVARTGKKNRKARKLLKGLGFTLVGPIPKGLDGKEDCMVFALEKNRCRWLQGHER
jgi:RimJ/RimL family protein N-acetyltransferase